jgi:fructokinase
MRRERLAALVRSRVATLVNGYVEVPEIVPPGLGSRAGVLGALALAQSLSSGEGSRQASEPDL